MELSSSTNDLLSFPATTKCQRYINPSPGIIAFLFTSFINKSFPPIHLIAVKTEAIWTSSAIPLPKTRSHCNLKTDSCISTRLLTTQFRFKGEWIGYRLYQIQKYQVSVSGTNEYQYQHASDTAKPCIDPSLTGTHTRRIFSGIGFRAWSPPVPKPRTYHEITEAQIPLESRGEFSPDFLLFTLSQ
ncbi:hypothetical protein AVEN_24621-1 [Araneus ventricosus]|uniref:Uncharacterized protein n=1 Tax=Araneus ventricosus TaxID=182803 RepID=A0A4Y2IKY7_ARAVE|nr:hypothetical protein AVEN_24621-1 [Araneus ventricosus]